MLAQHPIACATDEAKVTYIMGLLREDPSAWVTAILDRQPVLWSSLSSFTPKLQKVFDHHVQDKEAAKCPLSLHQGSYSVADYLVEFCILANTGWNQEALQGVFFSGLNEQVKYNLALIDQLYSIDILISLAIRLDKHMRERH